MVYTIACKIGFPLCFSYLTSSTHRCQLSASGERWDLMAGLEKIRRVAKGRNADLRDLYLHNTADFRSYQYVFVDESTRARELQTKANVLG